MSTLSVNINNAVLNKSQDFFGDMENYVIVRLNTGSDTNQQYKTSVVKGKKDVPIVWNQQFNFQIPTNAKGVARLEFFVMDEDVTYDDPCGQGIVNLDHCQAYNGQQSYKLRLYDSKLNQIQGDLNFTTSYR